MGFPKEEEAWNKKKEKERIMKHQIINKTSSYEYLNIISELLDEALNNLPPEAFRRLLDNVRNLLEDYEDGDES